MPFATWTGRGGKASEKQRKRTGTSPRAVKRSLSCITLPLCGAVSVSVLLMDCSVRVGRSALSQNGGPRRSSFAVMDEFGWKLSVEL